MKNQFYSIVTVIAIVAYFIPILIVAIKRVHKHKRILLFAIYWMIGGLVNMVDFIPGLDKPSLEKFSVIYNILDFPMILTFIAISSGSSSLKKFLKVSIPAFLVVEILNAFVNGLKYDSLKYTMGVGLLLVLVALMWEITCYLKRIEHSNLEKALLFILAALLFEYGSYIVVYVFDFFVISTNDIDNFLIYYISSIIAIAIACIGFLLVRPWERIHFGFPSRKYEW